MKKYFTYWILLFGIALAAGCKLDPVDYSHTTPVIPPTTVKVDSIKLLVGKWNYTSNEVKFYIGGMLTAPDPYTYSNGEFIQFNNDGTGKDYNTSFTYTLKNDQLTITYNAYDAQGLPIDPVIQTCTIKELSASKLTLYYDNSYKDSKNILSGSIVTEYLSR
jgi:hypothetical protein